jgi:hypothetical protein
MNLPRVRGSTRQPGRPRGRRIRFRDAIPLWRDRRDLRRQFRRAARAAVAERKAEMTALLDRLSANQVPLSAAMPGPEANCGVVVFADGTRLLLVTRHGSSSIRWLSEGQRGSGAPVWLVRAQPSFASCWFRLWFASTASAKPAELMARVGPVPAGSFR